MTLRTTAADTLLLAIVFIHLAVTAVHGVAHDRAHVMLPPAAMLFVFGVIIAGPLVGVAVQRFVRPRPGAWVIAATMAASLVFGIVNHFVLEGTDHVANVGGSWGVSFGITAALLAVTEALGSVVAVWCALAPSGKMEVRIHTRVGQ